MNKYKILAISTGFLLGLSVIGFCLFSHFQTGFTQSGLEVAYGFIFAFPLAVLGIIFTFLGCSKNEEKR